MLYGVIPGKIHTPSTDGKLEILPGWGGGLMAWEVRAGGGI